MQRPLRVRHALVAIWSLAAMVTGQQVVNLPVQVQAQVVHDAYIEVEHSQIAPISRRTIPAATALAYPSHQILDVISGQSSARADVVAQPDLYGNAQLVVEYQCRVEPVTGGGPARGESGGEMLVTFSAPVTVRGALGVLIDTRGSSGGPISGEFFVDVDDDGTFDFALGAQSAAVRSREFPFAIGPAGTRVRLLHVGNATGMANQVCTYRAMVQLVFFANASPVVPHRTGCAELRLLRWGNSSLSVGFLPAVPGSLHVLAAGAPVAPQPFAGPWGRCTLTQSLDAVVIVPGNILWLNRTLLPPGGQAVLQGFVFQPDAILATDSWLVN